MVVQVVELLKEQEVVDAGDKMKQELKCPLCEKKLYSSIGLGCKMCGMPLESDKNFCSKRCKNKYKKINKINTRRLNK